MAGRKYLRLTRADCLWAARQHHPIYVARRFWPRSKFPAGRYPTIRRAFKRHKVFYPWPVRLPRGHGCVEKAMGKPMPPAARTLKPGERRAARERKALRGHPIPKSDDRQADKYVKPAGTYLRHLTVKETEHWLAKFYDRGVVSRNTPGSEEYLPFLPDDCYYNRRMVRDAQVHVKAKFNGAKGGNPALLGSKAPPGGGQKPVERPALERPTGKVPARAGEEEPEEFWRRVLGPEYKDLAHFPGLRRHASQYEAVQSILKRTKTRSKEWPELGAFINKKLGKYDATRISGTLNRLFDLADTGEVKGDYWGMAEALLQKPDVHERELKRLAGVQRSGMTSISSIIGQGGEGGADGKY